MLDYFSNSDQHIPLNLCINEFMVTCFTLVPDKLVSNALFWLHRKKTFILKTVTLHSCHFFSAIMLLKRITGISVSLLLKGELNRVELLTKMLHLIQELPECNKISSFLWCSCSFLNCNGCLSVISNTGQLTVSQTVYIVVKKKKKEREKY